VTHNSTVSDIQSGRQKVIVLAGFLTVFEGDVCEQVIRFEGGCGSRNGGGGFRSDWLDGWRGAILTEIC
jgi:hypothetical protein